MVLNEEREEKKSRNGVETRLRVGVSSEADDSSLSRDGEGAMESSDPERPRVAAAAIALRARFPFNSPARAILLPRSLQPPALAWAPSHHPFLLPHLSGHLKSK